MKKVCFVATVPVAINVFLSDIIEALAIDNHVTLIANPHGAEVLSNLNAEFLGIGIARKPSFLNDMLCLIRLVNMFKQQRFDIVHSIMPKTGLLSMMAGFIVRTPVRVHTFTGQVWQNKQGYKRWLLKLADKLLVVCATHILVDSPSQNDFLVSEGILKHNQATVIGKGSICGVDINKFSFSAQARARVRLALSSNEQPIDNNAIILLFMARLTTEKGILELVEAFKKIAAIRQNVFLCVIGSEENVRFNQIIKMVGLYQDKLLRVDYTDLPADYLSACDILCLPSHREGFGQVIVNASACELPVVASKIYGITDAVEENVTGLLHSVHDVNELAKSILTLIDDKSLRSKMGKAGRTRVIEFLIKTLSRKSF